MTSASLTRIKGWTAGAAQPIPGLKFRSRRQLAAGAIVVLAVCASIYGYDWISVGRFIESTDDAYVGGNITAIAPHVGGYVTKIAVEDNQRVRMGQLLLRLDDRDFRASADHARAKLREEQAALANLQAKYVLQQSLILQSRAELASSQAAAGFAVDNDLRYQGLMRAVAVSRQDVQRAAAASREALAAVAAARAGLAAANQQLTVLQTEIDEARAAVAQAQADLDGALLNLSYTQIRSPVDGYVGNRAVHIGAYVSAGAYLISIIPAHGLWVDANFKEDQIAEMRPGQSVSVKADVLSGRRFNGRVVSIAPATGAQFSVLPPENATGNFTKIVQRVPVRILLEGNASRLGMLRPGLSVSVEVDTRLHG